MNQHPIDRYIDKYWVSNCPESLSVLEVNKMVHKLILDLFKKEAEFEVNYYKL